MRSINRTSRLARHWSNRELSRIAPLFTGEVLNVSGWDDRDKEGRAYRSYFERADRYRVTNHEGARGIDDAGDATDFGLDLCAPLGAELEGAFDVVYNHTTLEHIFDVETAFRNLCGLSRDVVIVVVPFAQLLHYSSSWGDYWRFTPMSLRLLFERNGMEVVYEAASPQADAAIYLLFVASRNPRPWRERMPAWRPIDSLGEWIGQSKWARVRRFVRAFVGGRKTVGRNPPVES